MDEEQQSLCPWDGGFQAKKNKVTALLSPLPPVHSPTHHLIHRWVTCTHSCQVLCAEGGRSVFLGLMGVETEDTAVRVKDQK